MSKHTNTQREKVCGRWFKTRPETEQRIRLLLAGHESFDRATRPVVVTAIGGHYGEAAGWAIALNGSPVQAMVVALRGGGAIMWRGSSPRTLQPAAVATVTAYLRSLDMPGHDRAMYVDGELVTGPAFDVRPWFWRDPDLYERLAAEEE